MEIKYHFWEKGKGYEEHQAEIYNKNNPGPNPVTAKDIIDRYERENIDPKTVMYAFAADGKMLAYIQARDYPEPKQTHIGYPWRVNDCPGEVQDKLFDDMLAGNFEEWTVYNRSSSDHTFHIHVNPFLITHINGQPLAVPEWRDTILVPAATGGSGNINNAEFGSITFRTWFDPRFTGSTVMHCHILTHEDVGMMQRLDIIR